MSIHTYQKKQFLNKFKISIERFERKLEYISHIIELSDESGMDIEELLKLNEKIPLVKKNKANERPN